MIIEIITFLNSFCWCSLLFLSEGNVVTMPFNYSMSFCITLYYASNSFSYLNFCSYVLWYKYRCYFTLLIRLRSSFYSYITIYCFYSKSFETSILLKGYNILATSLTNPSAFTITCTILLHLLDCGYFIYFPSNLLFLLPQRIYSYWLISHTISLS